MADPRILRITPEVPDAATEADLPALVSALRRELVEIRQALHLSATRAAPIAGTTAFFHAGNGTPEAVVRANPGSLYIDLGGGAGVTLYVKETGTGNTGWVAK